MGLRILCKEKDAPVLVRERGGVEEDVMNFMPCCCYGVYPEYIQLSYLIAQL